MTLRAAVFFLNQNQNIYPKPTFLFLIFLSFPGRERKKMQVFLLGLNSQKDNVILRHSFRKLL